MWGIFEIDFMGSLSLVDQTDGTKKDAEELVNELDKSNISQYVIMKIY